MTTLITVAKNILFVLIWSPFLQDISVIQIIINRRFMPVTIKDVAKGLQVSHLQLLPMSFKTNQRLVMKPKTSSQGDDELNYHPNSLLVAW